MRIVYTDAALADLDETLEYITLDYPSSVAPFEERLNLVLARIGEFPESSQSMAGRRKVRTALLNRYPYKVFYRVAPDFIEILYIHHAARDDPNDE